MAEQFALDYAGLATWTGQLRHRPLFVTISGAHLYGFPSPDSDIDLRGCHLAPLADIVRLDPPEETLERKDVLAGIEVEHVSHEIRKYLSLLVKNNGYVLEQIFSPLVVLGGSFLERLRPVARQCITRHHYHHYRGFFQTELRLLEKESVKRVKPILYSYRVLLTGIHLLRTGEVEANLPRLNESFRLPYIDELIAMKRTELAQAQELDWAFHLSELKRLEGALDQAFAESQLPEDRDRESINRFLVELRLEG